MYKKKIDYLSHAFCVHQVAWDLPPIFIGISSEPHRNLIGISSNE